jgi:hypothetical protein
MAVVLDAALMKSLGVAAEQVVRITTERGRSVLARLDPPLAEDDASGVVRLDRLVRQALKAHLNEEVEIEAAAPVPVKRVELTPAVDVSTAHDIVPHLKRAMVESRTPVSVGAVVYIPFIKSQAGTTTRSTRSPKGRASWTRRPKSFFTTTTHIFPMARST